MRTTIILLLLGVSSAFSGTAIHKARAMGRDYYIVFPKAAWGNQAVGVLINSPTVQKVAVTTPQGQKGFIDFTKAKTTKYYGGQFRIQGTPGYRQREATRIQSPDPISVHGQFGIQGISGTYTALPVTAWGNEYYAVAPPEGQNSTYYYYPTIYSVPMITIIGSYPSTHVTITPTATTSTGALTGVPFTITLNAGDVYNITTQGDPVAKIRVEGVCTSDLTGTHIVADHPVGVLAAQTHSSWPCGDNECGDYCVEWLPPVANWDSVYLVMPIQQILTDAVTEVERLVFASDGTTVQVTDPSGVKGVLGTFGAGSYMDYAVTLPKGVLLEANHPFLVVQFPQQPSACFAGLSGGAQWTLTMNVITGVNQWTDFVAFTTAVGSQSIGTLVCRDSDCSRLRLNGVRLTSQFPFVGKSAGGFDFIPIQINSAQYYELTGDSGATAGGSIYGFGTNRFLPARGHSGEHVMDPEVIKSFGHPIGGNCGLTANLGDITPPEIVFTPACAQWSITASDLEAGGTGIVDVWAANGTGADTLVNMAFAPSTFLPGDSIVQARLMVNNLSQPAQAHVYARDRTGNERDTLIAYSPLPFAATTTRCDVGVIPSGDSVRYNLAVRNTGRTAITITGYRLRYGVARHWSVAPPSPAAPFTVQPGDSVTFALQYSSPATVAAEFDDDSLFITTCREFTLATLSGRNARPAIYSECHEFGDGVIDSLGGSGDVLSSFGSLSDNGVWVTNIGAAPLHVTGLGILTHMPGHDSAYPASDFSFGEFIDNDSNVLSFPTSSVPWLISPGDTVFVEVLAHAHHTGLRTAFVKFYNDAGGSPCDTACLSLTGVAPPIVTSNVDYGPHLYGTTADSFFVARNSGAAKFLIVHDGLVPVMPSDTNAFILRTYTDPVTHSRVYYDSTVDLELDPINPSRGQPADTIRIPYRFIAEKLGANALHLAVKNTSAILPVVTLQSRTVQPHVAASSACPPDSLQPGAGVDVVAYVHNAGDDSMVVENLDVAGDRASEWSISRVTLPAPGITLTAPPWTFPLRGGNRDSAAVTLRWTPTSTAIPVTLLRITGHDRLGRHATDSVGATYYAWNAFPYDTTLPILQFPCVTGVRDAAAPVVARPVLWPIYPNPDPSSGSVRTISYTLARAEHIVLRLCNMMGVTVEVIATGERPAGTHAERLAGPPLAPGVYWCELLTSSGVASRELVVLR